MSKPASKILFLAFCSVAAYWPSAGLAQHLSATITVDKDRGVAVVQGKFSAEAYGKDRPITNLSFQQEAIGAPNLGARISKVELFGVDGATVHFRQLQPGEFVLDPAKNRPDARILSFRYEVDLRPLPDRRSAAHASWVTGESGLLFFGDILPVRNRPPVSKNAHTKLELPYGWGAATTLTTVHGTMMSFDLSNEVVLIGPRIRGRQKDGTSIGTGDTWQFADEKALTTASEIAEAYQKVFGTYSTSKRLVLLVRFPQQSVPKGTWEAETRGNTVILASSDMPFESQATQRLSEQMRHELFHLWLPNGVKLTGRYDWFYEGFALYQSLKTGVTLNQISFPDLLDTLSRAYMIDRASSADRLSLIDASAARWSGLETQVYARGMLVAFLCDLRLLRESNGKRSIETLLRELFEVQTPKFAELPEDGNTAVLRLLDSRPELQPIVSKYVRGSQLVDWSWEIMAAGIENESGNSTTKLRVASKLTRKQKTLLDKLGYNSWRKLTQK